MFDIMMLLGSLQPQKTIPARITCAWAAFPDERVRGYMATALHIVERVNLRLGNLLAAADAEARWNAPEAPEQFWFGSFSRIKAAKVQRTFRGIPRHLASPQLKVVCDAGFGSYGEARPGILRIRLGHLWHDPDVPEKDAERVQTFVHEAAHICGRFSIAEGSFYGRDDAHSLTRWRMRATRNADNYGYYAIDAIDAIDHPTAG
ncbi:M35 family metallo-endopeptidase [Vineibacter terrae]|nr:M35 family metallo-endopeptidase [Vineibacter terrae]